MPTLMISRDYFVLFGNIHILATDTHNNTVVGKFKILIGCQKSTIFNTIDHSLVDHVLNVGAAEAISAFCQLPCSSPSISDFLQIKIEDVLTTSNIWQRYADNLIESACSFDCRIQGRLQVGCTNHNNVFSCFKTIHFGKQLVYRVIHFRIEVVGSLASN